MAIGVHVVNVAIRKVNSISGAVLTKEDTTETLKEHMQFSQEHRVVVDSNVPSSATQPTVSTYLDLEAAADYVLEYMDQYTIITYLRNSTGGFPAP